MKHLLTALAAALLLLLSAPLAAQPENFPDDFDDNGTPPITGSIGGGAAYAPDFVGSKDHEFKPMPLVNMNYGPLFLSTDKGLGVRFDFMDGAFEFSQAVNYRFERRESYNAALEGMGNVKGTVTLGATLAYKFDDFVLSLKTFQGITETKGLTADLKAAYLNRSHENFNYGFSVSTTIADGDYNQAYFGVTPLQSERSGYRPYKPQAGFTDIGFKGTFDYYLTPQISLDFFAGYTHLIGEAADSPLVERGSEGQFSTGMAVLYHFGR